MRGLSAVDAAGQLVLRRVRDRECFVEVLRIHHSEHWSEDFLARKTRVRLDAAENRRTDVRLANFRFESRGHFEREFMLAFGLSDFDVRANLACGLFVDDGADVGTRVHWITNDERLRCAHESMKERLIRAADNNRAACCGTLLTAETERALSNAEHRFVKISRRVDDDGVLAAHFADNLLDELLPRCHDAGCLHDVETNGLRACERNDRHARIADEGRTNGFAWARDEMQHVFRRACAPKNLAHHARDRRRLLCRLDDDGVARHERSNGHAAANRKREVPRSDDRSNTARLIPLFVEFADKLAESLGGKEFGAFTRVVLAEVNRFADIRVCFAPHFARLFHDDRRQLIATRAHLGSGCDKHRSTCCVWTL